MVDIAKALGIKLSSLYLGPKKDKATQFHIKEENNPDEMDLESNCENNMFSARAFLHDSNRAESLEGKIKEIVRKREVGDFEPVRYSPGPVPRANYRAQLMNKILYFHKK